MLMDLTEEEANVISRLRADKELSRMEQMFQQLCAHEHMVYDGHGHNDDAYRCTMCGHIEWR